ncbi:XIAP-associated factor 1-like [Neodiprion pinetum]|uniref:XIAP-associated factor 1-like n=1 Tax=Neodiprion pinetum TaxID=441929 RepID=UPI001EE0FDE8|nr:XIAP-associated factor 1-like [Neodiprion pinetum]
MSENDSLTCDNCKQKIASQNYVTHTAHCSRHIELCNKCGEPVPKHNIGEHNSLEHANETCSGCKASIEKRLLEKHMQSECPKRFITCLYCELELPFSDMTAHTDYCGTRTEKCEDCGEYVMFKYTQLHLDSNHKFLKLEDEPGPSASWEVTGATASSARATSLKNGDATLLPCEFCDGMFTPNELRRHQISCTLGWCTTNPVLRKMSVVRCDICHKSIASRDYEVHRTVCDQRDVPIQADVVNTSVIPRDTCDSAGPFDEYRTHHTQYSGYPLRSSLADKILAAQARGESCILCDICNKSLELIDYQRHRINCFGNVRGSLLSSTRLCQMDDSTTKLPCEFCEESFSPHRLAAHQILCSPAGQQATIPCELCGELKSLAEVLQHQMSCKVSGDQ